MMIAPPPVRASTTSRIASSLFRLVPEVRLKNHLRAYLYNRTQHYFKIAYHADQDVWVVQMDGSQMLFSSNPHSVLITDLDYFRFMAPGPGDVAVDAGAFLGTFTIRAARMVGPSGNVIALEPDAQSGRIIDKNVALNRFDNVMLYHYGLWDHDDTFWFSHGHALSSSILDAGPTDGEASQIEVRSLDGLLADVGEHSRVFVKVNIEGAEVAALRGAEATLRRPHVALVIRTDHYLDGKLTTEPVERFLKVRDFLVHSIVGEHPDGSPSVTTYAAKGDFWAALEQGLKAEGRA